MSGGYLAISHPTWCAHILQSLPGRCAFWRRDTKRFKAIDPGDPFFILRKQRYQRPLSERAVIGHAEFRLSEVLPIHELGGYYGMHELGVSSVAELEKRLIEIAWDADPNLPREVGVIQLGPFKEFPIQVGWDRLRALGIGMATNVVQGIRLTGTQAEALLDAGLYGASLP